MAKLSTRAVTGNEVHLRPIPFGLGVGLHEHIDCDAFLFELRETNGSLIAQLVLTGTTGEWIMYSPYISLVSKQRIERAVKYNRNKVREWRQKRAQSS